MAVKAGNIIIGEGKPKVCVPIVGVNEEEILFQAGNIAKSSCDIVEFRADYYEQLYDMDRLTEIVGKIKSAIGAKELLFTIRTSNEGGETKIDFEAYSKILIAVSLLKEVTFVDVECYIDKAVKELITAIRQNGKVVIGSNHNFKSTGLQSELCERIQYISECGADIPKLAVMPQNKDDVVNLLMATYLMNKCIGKPIITMSMGALGTISRVSGETFGSAVTFACLSKASAPGQIDIDKLNEILSLI